MENIYFYGFGEKYDFVILMGKFYFVFWLENMYVFDLWFLW